MKTAGFFLLLAGWLLVLAALSMLRASAARNGFVVAGLGVEFTGLAIAVRTHMRPGDGNRVRK
jgi:hypothetical protein